MKVYAFSRGSEFSDFMESNCEKCSEYNFENPKWYIDIAIGTAYVLDGKVDKEIYEQIKTGTCKKRLELAKIEKEKHIDKETLKLFKEID